MNRSPLPRALHHPVTGDRIHILLSPLLGDGDLLAFRCWLPAGSQGAPRHHHETMDETFQVEAGALELLLAGGERRVLQAGDCVTVPAGTDHGFRNIADGETVFVTLATAGAPLERFLRGVYGLAQDGLAGASGMPRDPRGLALVLAQSDLTLAAIPGRLQRLAVRLLGWAGQHSPFPQRLAAHWQGEVA